MKSISLQYQDLKEGKMDKYQFLRNARMMFPNHVTNHNSFEDSVKILKNRGLLNEGDAVKGTPDKDPSYESPTPNADVKYKKVEQSPEVDEQDGIYPATTVTDIPKLKTSKKVKDKSDGLEPIKPHDTKNEMKKVKVAKASEQMLKEAQESSNRLVIDDETTFTVEPTDEGDHLLITQKYDDHVDTFVVTPDELVKLIGFLQKFTNKKLNERDISDEIAAWEEGVSDDISNMLKAGKISQKEHDIAQDYLENNGYDLYDGSEDIDVYDILKLSKKEKLKETIKRIVNEAVVELNSQSKKKLTEAAGEQYVDLDNFEVKLGNDVYIVSGTADVIGGYEEPNYVDGYTESPGGWGIEDIKLNLDSALKLDPSAKDDEGVEITSPEELKKLGMAIYKDQNAFNTLYDYVDSSIDYDNFD
jgi:hypothetical protein